MGMPSFYRWLVNKYPNIRVKAIEEHGDSSSPNPNGIEFDNLFLDMNGIVHDCFRISTTYEVVFTSIYEKIDHLFSIVRPRKLLYMAIDGVAPLAKMNQIRAGRFQTAKHNEIVCEEEEKLMNEFKREGKELPPLLEDEVSDSNIITPGTEFMHNLSKKLKTYIHSRMNTDPGWKDVQVILSDANVPGEGEHKIISFIRTQRSLPGYNCNTRHCLYGLDADLIMLALAVHEVHISILREVALTQEQQPACESAPAFSQTTESSLVKNPYEFVHIWILRQYLELDMMNMSDPPETSRREPEQIDDEEDRRKSVPPKTLKMDLERIIDDFIFMCFFTGNDFLPRMPTLQIHENCIDLLMNVYKNHFTELGGYLVNMEAVGDSNLGFIKLNRVEKFILLVGTYEEKIFKKRSDLRERTVRRLLECAERESREDESSEFDSSRYSTFSNKKSPTSLAEDAVSVGNVTSPSRMDHSVPADENEILRNTEEFDEKLNQNHRKRFGLLKDGSLTSFTTDKVKLGSVGWRERYYKENFSAGTPRDVEAIRRQIVQKYTEGLIWVLLCYFSGVPSWTWFYPYDYGPFASDLKGLAQVEVKFKKGHPFKPFDQLLAVLPPRSAHALPKPYARLMTDETSSIINFYPKDFEIDRDGKLFLWQGGNCKLPYIDKERLLSETKRLEKELTKNEVERNSEKVDQLFVDRSSNSASQIVSLLPNLVSRNQHEMVKVDATLSGGIGGFVRLCENTSSEFHLSHLREKNILSLQFELPSECLHLPRPLEGVQYPEMEITEADIQETQLWHEYPGRKPYTRPLSQERYRRANSSSFASSSTSGVVQNHKAKIFTSERRTEIHKFAGSGWGSGRGRTDHYVGEQMEQPSTGNHVTGTSLGGCPSLVPINPNAHPVGPTSNRSLNSSADQWKVGRGIGHLKVSESSQSFRPHYGQGQSATRNVISPATAGSTQGMQPTWKHGLQGNEDPSSSSVGRGQCISKGDRNPSRNTSKSFTGNRCPW